MHDCQLFLLNSPSVDDVLSLIELSFQMIVSQPIARFGGQSPEDAVEELNHRFREHGIGYQFAGGKIISVESLYLHTETVEPAVSLLHAAGFDGPLQEFMLAHEHYRKGNYKDAIVGAENAFESTMKTICDRRSWDYSSKPATAKISSMCYGTTNSFRAKCSLILLRCGPPLKADCRLCGIRRVKVATDKALMWLRYRTILLRIAFTWRQPTSCS